ncbi:GumC family protein, partial [Actinoallomurus sp. NPDC052274]|uniref:GumC family protein n=1 Tax=Actinoallomurus sp. NPDC052274 TaxID=3155420 RepID=UPI00341A4D1D
MASLVAGVIVTLLSTPQFRATSRIEISREQKKVTNVQGLDSEEEGRDQEFYQTQYSLLQARSLAERVERELKLGTNNAFFASHGVNPDKNALFSEDTKVLTASERARRSKMAISLLLDHVVISPIARSRLIDVSYRSASPELAAAIANAWVNQFIAANMDRRFASTADARKYLENRLNDLRTKLERSEREVVTYANEKDIVSLGQNQSGGRTTVERTLVSQDLDALNSALAEATSQRIAAESRLRSNNARGAADNALTNPAINGLRQRRAEVAAEYSKVLVQFEPEYPAAKALANQLQVLDQSIAREESRVQTNVSANYAEAKARELGLQQRVAELKGRLQNQQSDSIQYNIYQREADTNRQIYEGLLQRYKEIGVAGIGTNNVSVVDAARIPESPASPRL